ncbi:Mct1 [Bugula neritina]|uniref:Mct1 n=1 Tax=Bugula neritina TaxID=10212 RepID=A0A7J7J2E8_BUGNE|nr:Mct1 [Bugula neritina]
MVSQETQESQAKDSQANGRALESKGNPSHQQNGKQEALTERELEERLVKTIEPPDGGWGWMIVFCSFGLHVILDGITYSFGVIFVALLEDFQGGKGDTAWILSIFVGVTLGTGEFRIFIPFNE